jgi:hypothetical protein
MNQYLRNLTKYKWKNNYLENLIEPMWNLVLNSPEFNKEYIFYRFIGEDSFLNDIKIGDIYTENGFMSTTRDPFYRSDIYKFGFILIKIRIPKNVKGIALCLETISHFPEEQEIIFPPNSKFKLISKDSGCVYYHTDDKFSSKVKTRYEFEWIRNDPIIFNRVKEPPKQEFINFLNLKKNTGITLNEKINYFDNNYVNDLFQFNVELGNKEITVMTELYNSTQAYKNYYALETKNGYSMYAIYKGYILFFIELGETDEGKQIHVNYYVKYSSIDPNKEIGSENLIKFFSSIAYYFDISNVYIYASHMNCDIIKDNNIQRDFGENKNIDYDIDPKLVGGSYCIDLYEYLNSGFKKYSDINILNVEIQPKFSYHDLNILSKINPDKILLKEDRDEIYQLFHKYYKNTNLDKTITGFYLWLISQQKCYLLDTFINKIDRIFKDNNPFKNDLYVLDASTYLYNRKFIKTYPNNININITLKRNIIKDNKNDYRIR